MWPGRAARVTGWGGPWRMGPTQLAGPCAPAPFLSFFLFLLPFFLCSLSRWATKLAR
jgi:hypothetical protein